jgi:hypothetical protein
MINIDRLDKWLLVLHKFIYYRTKKIQMKYEIKETKNSKISNYSNTKLKKKKSAHTQSTIFCFEAMQTQSSLALE